MIAQTAEDFPAIKFRLERFPEGPLREKLLAAFRLIRGKDRIATIQEECGLMPPQLRHTFPESCGCIEIGADMNIGDMGDAEHWSLCCGIVWGSKASADATKESGSEEPGLLEKGSAFHIRMITWFEMPEEESFYERWLDFGFVKNTNPNKIENNI
jgi:hypothetical protein